MSENSNDQIFRAVFNLIEWTFDVSISAGDKATIEGEVYRGWNNTDPSDHELVGYLLQLNQMIWKVQAGKRDRLKEQARSIFNKEFRRGETNDRGRILATLHGILEATSLGVTGVRAGPPIPMPHLRVPVSHNTTPAAPPPNKPIHAGVPAQSVPGIPATGNQSSWQSTSLGQKNDLLRQQLDAYHEAEMLGITSNIAQIRHQAAMNIIGNIK